MTLDRRVPSRPCVGSHERCNVALDWGVPQGDLITMCHMVECDPSSIGELGRDPCLSDGGSSPSTCCQLGVTPRVTKTLIKVINK
jgi:hypothetical protein